MPKKTQSPTEKKSAPAVAAKAPHGSKSAFVRSQPAELSAKEVVEKAKAEGIKLSVAQVYNIRSTSKSKGPVKSAVKPSAKRSAPASAPSAATSSEARLRALIADVGLARARAVIAEVGAAFAG